MGVEGSRALSNDVWKRVGSGVRWYLAEHPKVGRAYGQVVAYPVGYLRQHVGRARAHEDDVRPSP